MTFAELQTRMRLADPTPLRETPQNETFVRVHWILSVALHLLFAYSFVAIYGAGLHDVGVEVARLFPIFQDRFYFLGGFGDLSYSCMTSVVIVSLALTPVSLATQIYGYRRTVIMQGGLVKDVSLYSAGYILQGWLLSSIFFWIIFVSAPVSSDVARVGLASILLWPAFPMIALPFICVVQRVIFSSLVLFWKFSMAGNN